MANEKRLVDAFESICKKCDHYLVCKYVDDETAECSQYKSPTVDARPVVHGRWERCGGDLHSSGYAIFCSVCNKTHFVHNKYSLGGLYGCKELFEKPKYCPSCGAVMEVEE
jgi:hypothetical protein